MSPLYIIPGISIPFSIISTSSWKVNRGGFSKSKIKRILVRENKHTQKKDSITIFGNFFFIIHWFLVLSFPRFICVRIKRTNESRRKNMVGDCLLQKKKKKKGNTLKTLTLCSKIISLFRVSLVRYLVCYSIAMRYLTTWRSYYIFSKACVPKKNKTAYLKFFVIIKVIFFKLFKCSNTFCCRHGLTKYIKYTGSKEVRKG